MAHSDTPKPPSPPLHEPGAGGVSQENILFNGNGLSIRAPPENLENVDGYDAGGYHPVELGDCLGKDGRYQVIHELGVGGFAIIWLCRDMKHEAPKYVAVKIIMAHASKAGCRELLVNKFRELGVEQDPAGKHIYLPLDQFQIDGPNGSHVCLVCPVLGPRVSRVPYELEDVVNNILRKVALQTVQAMTWLHSHGICHGGECFPQFYVCMSGFV
jgi:serine/threonine-protein kinase SRPK3